MPTFLRFVIRKQDAESRSSVGLFTEAYALRNADLLDGWQEERLLRALRWMEILNVPPGLSEPPNRRATCWFEDSAEGCRSNGSGRRSPAR